MKRQKRVSERVRAFIDTAMAAADTTRADESAGLRDEQVVTRARARVQELVDRMVAVARYCPTPMPTLHGVSLRWKAIEALQADIIKAVNGYAFYAADGSCPTSRPKMLSSSWGGGLRPPRRRTSGASPPRPSRRSATASPRSTATTPN